VASLPHPIAYQGSKRRLAELILRYAPAAPARVFEPFAGSAAVTLAAAARGLSQRYLLGDSLEPLCALWTAILHDAAGLGDAYEALWLAQAVDPERHYLEVRDRFNRAREPACLLYLLARCVKNAVRFNASGEFNQSADHRRRGTRPSVMRRHVHGAQVLLRGRARVRCADYRALLSDATPKDWVYLDPPYQGVSGARDSRYHAQLDRGDLVAELERLCTRGVPFVLSFDGTCGQKRYGDALPRELGLERILVHTGRSSQSTLSGRAEDTVESLYLSPALGRRFGRLPRAIHLSSGA
jgi:DNA adenine methylase